MEAHLVRGVILAAAAVASLGASYRTNNFVVNAPTQEMAEQIGRAAEKYRTELARDWLGHEMPNWGQPCPISAQVGENLGAGGATSFVFEHGEVFGWRMTIQGSRVRILDSVLPHEVTHTVFATHFRQPLPRWADEGACTTVEHASEKAKQQTMLIDLCTGRGIPFSRMFAMKEYPHDVMPLYSQGFSVARYLVAQGGKHKFLEFLADGLRDEDWARATRQHYDISDLATLQNDWLNWVRKGSPALDATKDGPALVAVKGRPGPSDERVRPAANLIYRAGTLAADLPGPSDATVAGANSDGQSIYQLAATSKNSFEANGPRDKSWHARRSSMSPQTAATTDAARDDGAAEDADPISEPRAQYEVTRPQAVQRSRQVILEWTSPRRDADLRPTAAAKAGSGPASAN